MAAAASVSETGSTSDGIKICGKICNYMLVVMAILALLTGIAFWIWEELEFRSMYMHQSFLQADPKFRESRIILLVAYILTLAFLIMIQCCIQISKDEHNQHVGPRMMIWIMAGSFTVLVFITCAALAATYKTDNLCNLRQNMTDLLFGTDFYNDSKHNNVSDTGLMFNHVQAELKCCGINGPDDYMKKMNTSMPFTCCQESGDVTSSHMTTGSDVTESGCQVYYENGCYAILYSAAEAMCNEIIIIGASGAAVCFALTLLRLALSYCYLTMKKNKQYKTVKAERERKQVTNGEAGPSGEHVDRVMV